jgi:thymidylate synthase
VFDPERDVTDSVYGGQCLSFLNFHLLPGKTRTLVLTAQYRNHYYIEKLLGNLIGLGRLMAYVAKEAGTNVGSLTVISTHATVDTPDATRQEITDLIQACEGIGAAIKTAA